MDMQASSGLERPTRDQLVAAVGSDDHSVRSLLDFCVVAPEVLDQLASLAEDEDWGSKQYVLLKYLAVHVPMAMEQGLYVWNKEQLVLRVGHLATPERLPLHLGLLRNTKSERHWAMTCIGEGPGPLEALKPPQLGAWPGLDPSTEVVLVCDLSFDKVRSRLGELALLPPPMQVAGIVGAVVWSIRRGLAVRQMHGEGRGYFVPVHLTSREGLPELAAAIQVQSDRLVLRALIDPVSAYAPARAVIERREELPIWLQDVWAAEGTKNEEPG